MTEEAQLKIRGLIQLALDYVVEPKPLSVPAVPETMDGLIQQLQDGLKLNGSEPVVAPVLSRESEEEAWDGQSFGNRLAGLGKLLANDSTKVALACKPPAESKTVIGMVDALGETLFRLAGFIDSIPVKVAGQTYKHEIQTLANNIFEAVAGMLNEFLEEKDVRVLQIQNKNLSLKSTAQGLSKEITTNTGNENNKNKDGYLLKYGIVWAACEIFEKSSRSNKDAVAKKWGDMISTMEDAIAEVKEMIESNDDKDDLKDDDDDDDEDSGNESDDSWNEDEKMTEEEKQMSVQANAHLKLTRLLLKKLQQRCLDTPPTNVVIPSSTASQSSSSSSSTSSQVTLQPSDLARMWDQLYDRAQGIVALADEIATSLYSPQDQKALLNLLRQLSRKNHDCILVGRLFVRGQVDQEKWLDMCEDQSKKILDSVVLLTQS